MSRITRESVKAKQAYMDYVSMGPDRSLEKLAAVYRARADGVPTRQVSKLKEWSTAFGWQARLQAIADTEAREAEEREAAYRREVLQTGYAVIHSRVAALKETAERLYAEAMDPNRRWLTEIKMVGKEKVEVRRFNASLFEQLRGVLSDIAKEIGGRREVTVLSGDSENPLQINHRDHVDLARLTDEELAIIETCIRRATVGQQSTDVA